MLVDEIIAAGMERAANRKIADLRVGLGYAAVHIDDGSCGMSFVFRRELGHKCSLVDEAGTLAGRSCREIIPWAGGINLVKSAIGLAVINALLQEETRGFAMGDALAAIRVKERDRLGMIGYFKPIIDRVQNRAEKIYVFERNGAEEEYVYPDWAAGIYLPECDVVVITGTTLLNKTIDHLLYLCRNAREIAIIGPSVPLCPSVFKQYGVHLIGGVRVVKPLQVLQVISEGGGARSLGDSIEQVYLRL